MSNNIKQVIRQVKSVWDDNSFKQSVRFCFVGLLNTVVGYGVYFLLVKAEIHYVLASFTAQVAGVAHSYVWNKFWTFKSRQKSITEVLKFVMVYALTFVINLVLLSFFIEVLEMDKAIAGFISLALVAIISFTGHKLWSFRK